MNRALDYEKAKECLSADEMGDVESLVEYGRQCVAMSMPACLAYNVLSSLLGISTTVLVIALWDGCGVGGRIHLMGP